MSIEQLLICDNQLEQTIGTCHIHIAHIMQNSVFPLSHECMRAGKHENF